MQRYRDFVLKYIDRIDAADAAQRADYFALVRSNIVRQIETHYADESERQQEYAKLDAVIGEIAAQYDAKPEPAPPPPSAPAPTLPPVKAPPITDDADTPPPAPKRQQRHSAMRRALMWGLPAVAALGAAFYLISSMATGCPSWSCHDSGWVRARNNETTALVIPHTLGRLPLRINVWYSRTGNEDVAQPLLWSWSEATTGNPVDIQVSPTETRLIITSTQPLHGLYDPKGAWMVQETGFFRVIVSK